MFFQTKQIDERLPFKREWRRVLEQKGLFPPRVSLGGNLKVYVCDEILAWERARIAGASDEQVRALILRLVAARAAAAADLLGTDAQKCATVPQ